MILGGNITSALTSFAGLGLALILESDGAQHVRLGWTDTVEPRMVVTAEGYDDKAIAAAVRRHAQAGTAANSWIQMDLEGEPWNDESAVFSPRIKAPAAKNSQKKSPSKEEVANRWKKLQLARWTGADHGNRFSGEWCSTEMIGALGEPAYWRFADANQKNPRPDEGASRWEMKTRNKGEDFVHHRLRNLASIVASRKVDVIRSGLCGEGEVLDEAYQGKRSDDSRTATGFTSPRFTDSALAWCAMWGIASFPVIHRLSGPSVTAGALPVGEFKPKQLVLPVLVGPHSLPRWRTLLLSAQLAQAAVKENVVAHAWLVRHGARALISFPLYVSDNSKAPERYLFSGALTVIDR